MAFVEDAALFFPADLPGGKRIVFGAYQTVAAFDAPGSVVLGVMLEVPTITFRTAALPGLARGSAITVDGTPYRVREVQSQNDGAVAVATLEKT